MNKGTSLLSVASPPSSLTPSLPSIVASSVSARRSSAATTSSSSTPALRRPRTDCKHIGLDDMLFSMSSLTPAKVKSLDADERAVVGKVLSLTSGQRVTTARLEKLLDDALASPSKESVEMDERAKRHLREYRRLKQDALERTKQLINGSGKKAAAGVSLLREDGCCDLANDIRDAQPA